MRFLKKFPSIQIHTILANLFTPIKPSQVHYHYHTNLKLSSPNQTLKQYIKINSTIKALLLFRDLLRKNTSSIDSFSLLFVIKACTKNPSATEGKQFHTLVIKLGYETIIFLQTSLLNSYSAKANLAHARRLFEEMTTKNVVCWTAMISFYVDNQKPNTALKLFRKMQMGNVNPDQVTLTVALSACADLGTLDMGKWIHNYIQRKKELKADLSLYNALLNMYVKSGDVETAKVLFGNMDKKDVTTWTSMIMGYALHGQAKEALKLFTTMKEENKNPRTRERKRNRGCKLIVPNDVTFIGVLMACSHAGMVEEGKRYFKSMREDYGIKPRVYHYGCMVDLLCRAGRLQEANDFILAMPVQPNAVLWRTLLGACSIRGNIDLAAKARNELSKMEECLVSDDVIMANIYAAKGVWDKKEIIRGRIDQRRAPGCSSIEVGSDINEFVAGADDHPFAYKIYEVLECLIENMRTYGYTAELCE